MPRVPHQVSPFPTSADSAPGTASVRPKLRTRREPKAPHATPLVALLSATQTARYLDVSTRTLTRWVKQGIFPAPVYLTPTSPAKWRLRDLDNWISKRAAGRHARPALRGALARLENGEG